MKVIIGLFILLIVIIIGIVVSQGAIKNAPFNLLKNSATATIKGNKIILDIAKSNEERQIGLSEKDKLEKNNGMLFVFESTDYHPFWMQNMKFPIDIIYLRGDKVVSIFENMQPPAPGQTADIIKPEEPADKVLEITAGSSKEYNIQKGDTITFKGI